MVEAVVYVFGALLLYVAYRAFRGGGKEANPENNLALRAVRRVLPTTDGFRENKLFVREGGRLMGTPLLLTVVAIMAADIACGHSRPRGDLDVERVRPTSGSARFSRSSTSWCAASDTSTRRSP
jgi:hypothetical protein